MGEDRVSATPDNPQAETFDLIASFNYDRTPENYLGALNKLVTILERHPFDPSTPNAAAWQNADIFLQFGRNHLNTHSQEILAIINTIANDETRKLALAIYEGKKESKQDGSPV